MTRTPAAQVTEAEVIAALQGDSASRNDEAPCCPEQEAIALVLAKQASSHVQQRAAQHLLTCTSCRTTLIGLLALPEPQPDQQPAPIPSVGQAQPPPAQWPQQSHAIERLLQTIHDWLGSLKTSTPALTVLACLALSLVLLQQPLSLLDPLQPVADTPSPAQAPNPKALRAPQYSDRSDLQPKGTPDSTDDLTVAVLRNGQRFRLQPQDDLRIGDQLGFFYTSTTPGYLALFIAGPGTDPTQLFPTSGGHSGPIPTATQAALPDGAIMQSEDGCEWIIGVFSSAPLALDALQMQIAAALAQTEPLAPAPAEGCPIPDFHVPQARTTILLPIQ